VRADVEAALALRPDATLLGVKYGAVLYPEIEHVWTQHLEQAPLIRERVGRPVFIHARRKVNQHLRGLWFTAGKESDLDYVWPSLHWVSWSSGFAALLWARHGMGFDEVIGCGITLDPGGYCPEVAAFKKERGDRGKSFVDTHALESWRRGVINFRREGKTQGIFAMSGWMGRAMGAPC